MLEPHNITRRTAAALFNVPEENVTDEMLARARTVQRPVLFGSDRIRAPFEVQGTVSARLRPWPKCPDCRQDATGVYGGKHGCNRCGWTEGEAVRRRTFL